MTTPGTSVPPTRWRCDCTVGQAVRWLTMQADHAFTEGGEAAVILAEVADHFLSRVRRAA